LWLEFMGNFKQMSGKLGKLKSFFWFRSFVRREDGTTAIEFSLLFIPYLMLTLGIIELSIMYSAASLLEGATNSAARLIRTGQIQQNVNTDPEAAFRDAICNYARVLVRCEDVVIEVQQINSFANFDDMAPQYDEDGNMTSRGFVAGGSNDRVLVRTAFRYQMMTPLVGLMLSGSDGSIGFMSTMVLQTEPYEFTGGV